MDAEATFQCASSCSGEAVAQLAIFVSTCTSVTIKNQPSQRLQRPPSRWLQRLMQTSMRLCCVSHLEAPTKREARLLPHSHTRPPEDSNNQATARWWNKKTSTRMFARRRTQTGARRRTQMNIHPD